MDTSGGVIVSDPISLRPIEIQSRERSFSCPDEDWQPAELLFGEHIHLRGYEIGETDLAPGGALPLRLCWQADEVRGALDSDLSLFVHLLGPDGVPHGQVDRVPGRGAWPTSSWAPGQVVVDHIDLPVDPGAPPGEYHIAVGFYDPRYGDRLEVTSGSQDQGSSPQAVLPVQVAISGSAE